jgi:sugar phosphate isomerase/epimerase
MTLDDLLEFCAGQGFIAVDITGYYFKGYPQVPSDETLYQVKRKAFSLGLEICGTGVRNDFTHADPAKRTENVQLVKNRIHVCQKLGGQAIRIFSGTQEPEGYTRAQILQWMLDDIRECVDYGKAHGVVVALQNHNDFVKTAAHTIEIMESIQSPWFGLMLDIGSFRKGDPYEEIARTIKYAVTWQIKEKVFVEGEEVVVDADKLMKLIKASDFRGYLPLETLGEGDPKIKVTALHQKFLRGPPCGINTRGIYCLYGLHHPLLNLMRAPTAGCCHRFVCRTRTLFLRAIFFYQKQGQRRFWHTN